MDIALGVEYLHVHDVIHGDLKGVSLNARVSYMTLFLIFPTQLNVLIDDSGRARIADFGISSVSDPKIPHWTSQSAAASKGGTARWQAPELNDPEEDDDDNDDDERVGDNYLHNTKESDVYAWSCVCYEVIHFSHGATLNAHENMSHRSLQTNLPSLNMPTTSLS